ncbi:MAG: beta-phosphoglucomutase [Tissierellaceae bacterium]
MISTPNGVLVSTDEIHYKAWRQLAEEINISFDRKIFNRFRGVSRMDCLELLLANAHEDYSDVEKEAMANRKNHLYLKHLQKLSEKDICEGAKKLLMELESNGVLIAVGSSSKNTNIILEKTGLLPFIDTVVDGNEITKSKPDPEVFILAADRLGVPYESCMVIEDAESGIEAARSVGMKVIGIGDAVRDCVHMDLFSPLPFAPVEMTVIPPVLPA